MSVNDNNHPISEDDLHAYVDGLLSPTRRDRVRAWLATHPEDAARVADWQRQNAALDALFPAPEAEARVQNMLDARPAAAVPGWAPVLRLAAALALVAVGLGAGWLARGMVGPPGAEVAEALVDEAMNAHLIYAAEVLHPVEVPASDAAHLVGWLSKRLGVQLSAPDLSADGYRLMGGRLLPADSGPAAQFMYEDAAGRRITVYATTGAPGTLAAFQFEERGDIAGIYWQDEALRYAVIGPLSRPDLASIATDVYRQLI